ncbi:signal recognition particle-docking protein FtsY [Candidatus Annandia pinicola]|uniref:signal recognition particle-docking protein FtsY n=1 Tax=Candidatus Annandia pinicola TaxID=1345117 RepID=UPI001D02E898|nr:signal recognition particle-docking protein FtsY [Candidatus Annandia pinicola]
MKNRLYKIINKDIIYKLKKTFIKIINNIKYFFKIIFKYKNNDQILLNLKKKLLKYDIGLNTTEYILNKIKKNHNENNLNNIELLNKILNIIMSEMLKKLEQPLIINYNKKPFVILIVGVNGVGKTTTVAKLANKYKKKGKKVMLAAADTFRSSAITQLKTWGKKINTPVISRRIKSDAASVVFDSLKAANSKRIDILIIDTSGIMHNKNFLMRNLIKIINIVKKINNNEPDETILIIDSNNGQNSIKQIETFRKSIKISSLIINKIDNISKGGIIFPISHKFNIPIRYIGVGDKIEDIKSFKSENFVKYLLLNLKETLKVK